MKLKKKHKRIIARILLVTVLCMTILSVSTILVGCGNNEPVIISGEIYGKEYIPAQDWTEKVTHIRIGKVTYTTHDNEKCHIPEQYILHIRQFSGSQHKYIYAAFEVSKEVYEEYDFYDIYTIPGY